jgi:purine nucleosidase
VVFRANWDVTMVGLDLTHQALATKELQDRVRAVGGPIAKFILDIWEFIATTHGVCFRSSISPTTTHAA